MKQLKEALCGSEKSSHLGPDITSVNGLMKLNELDNERLDGLKRTQAGAVRLQTAVDHRAVLADQLKALRAEFIELKAATPLDVRNAGRLCHVSTRIADLNRKLDDAATQEGGALNDAGTCGAELAKTMAARNVYLFHRSIVVDSYGVTLVRAAFLRARRRLVWAAFLTLLGAALYAYILPADPTDEDEPVPAALQPAPAVILRLDPDGAAYRGLPARCGQGGDLTAYVISGADFKEHGPATVVLASGTCAGLQLRVGDDEGTLQLQQ
ncbi:hypothetical protein SAMN05660657_01478 [Geodermatophilus amargosae]|uniref:Uncharacterized protein n=1 Tax=Geodermatophilus amargosae TaxID=1296565 RepID=A0A1I6YY72_9ACTN|nr:hypothetical protein [Geodermatophilus amargosae]SFT55406.1 hypothetical protein SAMN05660657_01478 [Geodermatophilus amargosae]